MPCPKHPQRKKGKCSSCVEYLCCNPLIPGCSNLQAHQPVRDLPSKHTPKKRKISQTRFSRGIQPEDSLSSTEAEVQQRERTSVIDDKKDYRFIFQSVANLLDIKIPPTIWESYPRKAFRKKRYQG